MMRNDLSIVVIVKDEETNLEKNIPIWKKICEEVVIVDSGSKDRSKEISLNHGCNYFNTDWRGYGPTKNFGNSKAKNDWILSLDADEIPDYKLLQALSEIQLTHGTVYEVNRLTSYCGKFIHHCGWHPQLLPRIFNRTKCEWNSKSVHERLNCNAPIQTQLLSGKLLHYSFNERKDHLFKLKKYASLQAQEWMRNGIAPSIGRKYWGPAGRFITTYFFKLGFLDGQEGFEICKNESKMVMWQVMEWENLQIKR